MGNRAVVRVEGSKVGVYLHWNGGRESIEAFLRAAKDLGVRDPIDDTTYFYARFTQIVGNFFGGTTSVGVGALTELDTNGDNGVWVIGADFKIVSQGRGKKPKTAVLPPFDQDRSDAIYADVMAKNQPIFSKE